jgi:uncharacterized protein
MRALIQRLNSYWLINAALFILVGSRYLPSDAFATPLASLFLVCQYLGQLPLIAFAICWLLPLLLSCLLPKRQLMAAIIAASLASVALIILTTDTFVYQLYHFHINGILLKMALGPAAGDLFKVSLLEWAKVFGLIGLIIGGQMALVYFIWSRPRLLKSRWSLSLLLVSVLSLTASHALHAYADAVGNTAILENAQSMPLYFGLTARRFIVKHHWLTPEQILAASKRPQRIATKSQPGSFHYPLSPLKITPPTKPMNILVIGIDAWRADSFSQGITPHIWQIAKNGLRFSNHFSGGNSTQAGVFSLFYALPSTYWKATYNRAIPPVLFDVLQQEKYRIGIFMSASMLQPPFYRNVFASIKPLPAETKGGTAWVRDKNITTNALRFIKQTHKPFFMFMFYDSAHAYDFPPHFKTPFKPWWHTIDHLKLSNHFERTPYFNRYKNSLYYIDGLVGKVLQSLRAKHLLKNTVIVFTADHGEEFNDNHQNYWGHSSNFSAAQTHVPLIIVWPGKKPQVISYKTSHFDLMPTLLKNVLGVRTPMNQYSVGHSLLKPGGRDVLVMGSYMFQGIVSQHQIVNLFPGGTYRLTDDKLHPAKQLNVIAMGKALRQIRRFY